MVWFISICRSQLLDLTIVVLEKPQHEQEQARLSHYWRVARYRPAGRNWPREKWILRYVDFKHLISRLLKRFCIWRWLSCEDGGSVAALSWSLPVVDERMTTQIILTTVQTLDVSISRAFCDCLTPYLQSSFPQKPHPMRLRSRRRNSHLTPTLPSQPSTQSRGRSTKQAMTPWRYQWTSEIFNQSPISSMKPSSN